MRGMSYELGAASYELIKLGATSYELGARS
jgi:hypothetical protein